MSTPTDEITEGDVNAAPADGPESELAQDAGVDAEAARAYREHPMVPVRLLVAHPDNIRTEAKASKAFCASVAAMGIIDPLEITTDPETGLLRVVDGNLRLDAARKVGLEEVPYFFSFEVDGEAGRQYLHMLVTSHFKNTLSPREEAAALFSASQTMTKTQIRRATGLKATQVSAGIQVAQLKDETVAFAQQGTDYEWTLEDLALLAPFEDDEAAMTLITREVAWGRPLKYTVQRLHDDRAANARRQQLIDELENAGTPVSEQRPEDVTPLHALLHDEEQELTPEQHADCPGRGAYWRTWDDQPIYYCASPAEHGHLFKATGTSQPPEPPAVTVRTAPQAEKPAAERRIVVEGNKAWSAAATVRQQWLSEFLNRKTPPKDATAAIARFVTAQLLTMPEPLRRALADARHSREYESFGAPSPQSCAKTALPGLWMLALTPIATAYEREISGDGERRATWRSDKYSPCSREDAGTWLAFLAEIGAAHGYTPSPIERCVAEGTEYQGDTPTSTPSDTDEATTDDDGERGDDQPGQHEDQADDDHDEEEATDDTDMNHPKRGTGVVPAAP